MWPEQETPTSAAGEKRSIESEESLVNKRCKSSSSSTTNEWSPDSDEFPISLSEYNPLNEPSPVRLQLNKSPSLLELIRKSLLHNSKNNDALPSENLQAGNKKHVKEEVQASSPLDKLKASNFRGLLLRIGRWEYKSKHEGDLVAKCYFAKHKLVWEILDDGIKNKIEMQWSDIVGLKANCPDNGPSTLTIVLGKQPLFFRENDPQPRKHTLWQATSDFTNGEASTYRQHYLECPQGVLSKHYEKLIQCDTRLNFLSQQSHTNLDFPFVANDPNALNNADKNGCSQPELLKGFSVSRINNMGTLDSVCGDFIKEYGYAKISGLEGSNTIRGQINTPRLQQSLLNYDPVNHIRQHCIAEKKPDPVFENVTMLDKFSEILQDTELITAASDERSLVSRVDSICCLLQDGNDYPNPGYNPIPDNGDQELGMSRRDSFSDLVNQLPGITSLPMLSPDNSGDGNEMLNP